MPRTFKLGPDDCALVIRAGARPELFLPQREESDPAGEAEVICLGLTIMLEDPVKREWVISLAKSQGDG